MNETRIERWAFTLAELQNPVRLTSFNRLTARTIGENVIVYRNGAVSDMWKDESIGVPESAREMAGRVCCHFANDVDRCIRPANDPDLTESKS